MDAVAWTVIGTGVAILIAIATAFRALRREILEQRIELGKRIDAQGLELGKRIETQGLELGKRIDAQGLELGKRIDAQGLEISALNAQMHRLEVELRERMAKVEGLLEGLREAISGKRAA